MSPTGSTPAGGRLRAVLRQRCPRCGEGDVFRTAFRTHDRCPDCELTFHREPGYWVGALYFSYGLALLLGGPAALLLWWWGLSAGWNAALVALWLLPWTPWIVRVSKVAWLHFDGMFDPP